MSVFVQNIFDIPDSWLCHVGSRFEEGVFEDYWGQIVVRSQMNKDGSSDKWGSRWGLFLLSWSEGIPFRVETCESFISVDWCHESVTLITCDWNVEKRNCIVLFKLLWNMQGKSVINLPIPKRRTNFGVHQPIFLKSYMKMLANTLPNGQPVATPSIWS